MKQIGGIELHSFSLNYLDQMGDYNRLITGKPIGFFGSMKTAGFTSTAIWVAPGRSGEEKIG